MSYTPLNESIYQKEQRLLREYHAALEKRHNYDAKVLYKELTEVREIIKKADGKL